VFGFATFGRVYGAIICISGLVNFSQYGLDALTQGVFDGNPTPINISFAISGFVVGSVLVVFVRTHAKMMREKESEYYQNWTEREPLIPEAIQEVDE
jgi:phosphatidylserine synthase